MTIQHLTCPTCKQPKSIRISHSEKNNGRKYAKCFRCDDGFMWLDSMPTNNALSSPRASKSAFNNHGEKQQRAMDLFALSGGRKEDIRQSNPDNPIARSTSVLPQRPSINSVADASGNAPKDTTLYSSEASPTGLSFLSDVSAIKATESEKSVVVAPTFTPSKYQEAIFDFVRGQSENAVVEAVAGSGKTTTLVKALEFTPSNLKVGFVAFNKHIATELQKRAPEHVHVSTLHSLGFSNIRKMIGKVEVDDKKLWNIFNDMTDNLPEMVHAQLQESASNMIRLVNLCKGTLRLPEPENLDYLCDRYGIDVNGDKESIYDMTGKLWHRSISNLSTVDFEDMIFACADHHVPCQQFDILFVDESQDLNQAQIQMALMSGKRVISVGDRKQSIYGFRGADTDAIPNLISALSATTLPLSISYRCPKRVIELAKTIVPQIEYRENAPDGLVSTISESQMFSMLGADDLVLCRVNAPLVKPCFEMIRRGIKATIRGRDIGANLSQLIDKCSKKSLGYDLRSVLYTLSEYVEKECSKLLAADKGTRAQSLQDSLETILALSDGCYTVNDVKARIQKIFSDDVAAISFSSVHKAKGLESNRVFILHPELIPHPLCRQDWERQAEQNLKYVAITRAKSELYWVVS